ncbi:MAG: methionine--tRNA ligase, partial [Thermoplasmata archaeon]|nr:methionine--tRNA ligase [Thermoplasmata archaeon]
MTDGVEKVFIGVAWPYANGPIHMGHVAGCYLPPDIFARYNRMRGRRVLMVSGSDEHGTPITVTAEKEGVSPGEVASRYHRINSQALRDLGVSFDLFTETSTENHRRVVHDLFLRLLDKGHIYRDTMVSPFCPKCLRFLPDRYVEGICPHCGSEGARGDQCDVCGKTLDPEELVEPRCKICGSTPEMRETEHFFLRLSAFEKDLLKYLEDKNYWKANTLRFTRNWLRSGLKDRAITRDITWGVDVPVEGFEDKRIYVWFEAVIGYLSASKEWAQGRGEKGGNPEEWRDFWEDPGCRHYYFLGKDNIPFHTIIWPAMLMGYGGLNLPYNVVANEYLHFRGEKFSKSRGNIVSLPDYLAYLPPDVMRYYLTANMPENRDADFTWEDFIRRVNEELVSTLGNFVHRVLTFTHKHFGAVPPEGTLLDEDREYIDIIEKRVGEVAGALENCEFKKALSSFMEIA